MANKDTKLYVDSKNIRLKINDKEYTFEFDDCVQVREEAIILNSNKVPRYIIALTSTVPGDFSNIDSIEDDQYQISENMIVFYYKTTNGNFIVYSKDQGESWQTEKIPSGGNIKSIKFPNADVGYILEFSDEVMSDDCGAIYKTTNSGISWEKVYTGIYNGHDSSFSTGTKMVFANENVGFITMPDIQGEVSDLYITKDGGVTFEKE